jgi:hypothetical protein
MTMICIADKNRLALRGVRNGRRYLVKKKRTGWWVEPARNEKKSPPPLFARLDALAAGGFSFEPQVKENIPPCRF